MWDVWAVMGTMVKLKCFLKWLGLHGECGTGMKSHPRLIPVPPLAHLLHFCAMPQNFNQWTHLWGPLLTRVHMFEHVLHILDTGGGMRRKEILLCAWMPATEKVSVTSTILDRYTNVRHSSDFATSRPLVASRSKYQSLPRAEQVSITSTKSRISTKLCTHPLHAEKESRKWRETQTTAVLFVESRD